MLSYLADTIGYRVAGTPGAERAAAYLVQVLQRIPRVEVAVQEATGAWRSPVRGAVVAYTVRNVLARIPGRSTDAVLLSAHYDSPPGSVGAGDDGVGVAALVEVVRALAAGPPLPRTVIVNLNDGEEQGLVGARAFTQHPWCRTVRAFVNLESAGPHGRAVLFQAGPRAPWLTTIYARAVPYPFGTVVAQDIFQSGAIPSDTDFRIYRDVAGLAGLDIALFEGGWAYHTQRDRVGTISPGTVQHMGENALALARALARDPFPARRSAEPAVYYDLLGAVMVVYSARTARWLAVLAIGLGLTALAVAMRRGRITGSGLAEAVAVVGAAVVLAVLAALALATLAAYGLRRPMSWFAHPGPGILAFAMAALAAALAWARALEADLLRRGGSRGSGAAAIQGATLLLWMLLLALLTRAGLGSGYLALWWVAWGAVGLLVTAVAKDRWWWIGVLAGAVPAGLLTLQLLVMLTALFVPITGRLPLTVAPDLGIAALVALPAAALALALLPGAYRVGSLGAMATAAAALAVVALAVSVAQPRYTFRHPQRLVIRHVESDAGRAVHVAGMDYTTPRAALAHVPGMQATGDGPAGSLDYARPADPTSFPPPRLDLLDARNDPARGTRAVTLRAIAPGAYRLQLTLPGDRLVAWSIPAPLPDARTRDGTIRIEYVAPPDTGWRFTLELRGDATVALRLAALRDAITRDAGEILRALPTWTDAHVIAVNERTWRY